MNKHQIISRRPSTFTLLAALILPSATVPVLAQTVPDNTNLNSLTPVNGSIWDLQGNAFLSNGAAVSFAKALPTGPPGLTINGVAGGSIVTMNDGAGHFGFFSGGASTLNLSNVTFVGGNEVTGGAISLTGALTVNGDLSVSNNAATNGNGGAVAVTAGGITVNGGLVANNNTSGSVAPNTTVKGGGAIYAGSGDIVVSGNATLNANITTATNSITGAGAGPGGAIRAANGNVRLATAGGSVTLTNNLSSSNGGAIFAAGAGAGNVSLGAAGSTLVITGNSAGFTPGGAQVPGTSSGGAISNTVGTTTLTGNSILFANNKATSNGGAIASLGVNATGNVTATNNTLTGGNGGFINAGTGGVTVNGTLTANNNLGATSGGAIFTTGAVLVTGNVSLDNNVAASVFNGQGNGGAIAATTAASNVSLATTSGNVSITNNRGSWSGGGIISNGSVVLGNSSSVVTITGNRAGFNPDGSLFVGSVAFGGGVRVFGTTTLNGTAITLSDNTASANGGGIYSNNAVTINGNLTADGNTSLANGTGGAINAQAGGVTVNGNLSANRNVAGIGGGINAVAGDVTVNGAVTMDSNVAGSGAGGAINAAGGNVNLAPAGGTVSFTNNTAASNGGAISATGTVTLDAGSATVFSGNSAGGKGGAIWGGSDVTLNATGGDISFSGNSHVDPQANAIYLNNSGGASTTTFNAGAGRTITFFDPVQSNAANGLVTVLKTGDGLLSFDASRYSAEVDRWSQVYGDTQVQAGTFEVANQAIYGARATDVSGTAPSSFVLGSGTTLAGGVAGTVRADQFTLGSNSTLDIAGRQPVTRATFTIDSASATFNPGSRILFNTRLNDAVVQDTDVLVLNHAATSGTASLQVTNVGGLGAVTVGNGIKVVDAINGASTSAGTFTLAGPAYAGPFEYTLHRSSVDGSNDQAWYLRSTIDPVPPDPSPPAPSPPDPVPAPVPNFRPQTSLYTAVPALALVYTRTLVDTLHERVGEERLNQGEPRPANDEQTYGPSLGWGRMIYRSGEQDGSKSILGNTPGYNYDLSAFQVGVDLYRDTRPDGSHEQAGVSLAVGNIDGGVKHYTGNNAGDDTLRAYSLGAYWTHFGQAGWYLDGVLQLHHFDIEAKPTNINKLKTDGWGYTASVEAGYPFEMRKDLFVEPQAQLIYSSVDLDDSHDLAADVRFEDVDSLIGRLGVRIAKDWETTGSDNTVRRTNAWVRPSVWHEFKGQPKTEFSSQNGFVPFEADISGTWGEVNVGIDYQANARTTFTVSTGYRQAFDGDSHGYDGMLGVKVAF
ncbi:autotransporter outer membrane beta-barrel domain-containing protein [Pseudomonas putida]|uniref:Autotransporter outer membrane beta-barrel domain-containing protein n=1 Tax=Pseudomonas putida TaxID=303 RepID=A0A2Z4RSQ3_PSEPU|nr:autotransporter outer membrane beta-barrel domain-containing protein [Pseudomonas putida]AWY44130.1 autotransporter outer membrane beta-barrel domain-containing protein [Pseudomonas putida]